MNNIRCYKRNNSKNGYTILLIMIVLLLVVYWSIIDGSELAIQVANQQNSELKKSGIIVDMTELPEFELNN